MSTARLKRASLMPSQNVVHYQSTHFYLFDDIEDPYTGAVQNLAFRKHQTNCRLMSGFVQQYTDWKYHSVRFTDKSFTKADFQKWWIEELGQYDNTALIVVYFHGEACGRGKKFNFKQRSKPRDLNAYKLFDIANRRCPDIFWILDCPYATRFLEVPHKKGKHAHSEYTIAGQNVANTVMDAAHGPSDWTYQLTQFLTHWVDEIDGAYKHWMKRRSIPEVLKIDTQVASNPLRLWDRKTKKHANRPVFRLCIDPVTTRGTHSIKLIKVQIQGKLLASGPGGIDDAGDSGNVGDNDGLPSDVDLSDAESASEEQAAVISNDEEPTIDNNARDRQDGNTEARQPPAKRIKLEPIELLVAPEGAQYVDLTEREQVFVDMSEEDKLKIKNEFHSLFSDGQEESRWTDTS